MDEVARDAQDLPGFETSKVERTERQVVWTWPATQAGLPAQLLRASLDGDGHFVVEMADVDLAATSDDIRLACEEVTNRLYEVVLGRWSVVANDIKRGIIIVGSSYCLGDELGRSKVKVLESDPSQVSGQTLDPSDLEKYLFIEAARRYVESTTPSFRATGRDLADLRESAAAVVPSEAEALAVDASRKVEAIRATQTRLLIATQVLRDRLTYDSRPDTAYREDIAGLILIAEHMRAVWLMSERNYEWVVEHIKLRVAVAERASTRAFTAAVFAVAVAALVKDVVTAALTVEHTHTSALRLTALAVGSLAVLGLSYGLYRTVLRLSRVR